MGKIIKKSLAKPGSEALSNDWVMFSWNKPSKQPPKADPKATDKTKGDKQREK